MGIKKRKRLKSTSGKDSRRMVSINDHSVRSTKRLFTVRYKSLDLEGIFEAQFKKTEGIIERKFKFLSVRTIVQQLCSKCKRALSY